MISNVYYRKGGERNGIYKENRYWHGDEGNEIYKKKQILVMLKIICNIVLTIICH